jgi:hypothetical protein
MKPPSVYRGWRDPQSAAVLAEVRKHGPSAPLNLRNRYERRLWRRVLRRMHA